MNKKILSLLIVPAMFLASCSGNPTTPSSNDSKTGDVSSEVQDSGSEGTSVGGNSSTSGSQTSSEVLKMPTNLKMVIMHKASTKPYEMYKVGDTYEFIHNNDYGYAVKTATGYRSYYGEKSGGSIDWDSEASFYPTLFQMLNNNDFGDVAELGDPNGYCNEYCSEKSEKKTIVGVETTLYGDENFSWYVDKTTNLAFEYYIGSTLYVQATEYVTSSVTLPFEVPAL